jgi:FkbM family methyltransferase
VTVVLDIGANRGDYGLALRRLGYGGRIVSFEPLSEPFQLLSTVSARDPLWRCEHMALGDASGNLTLHVATNRGASSSFLPMTETMAKVAPQLGYVADETVAVRRLDDLMSDLIGSDDTCFAKIDVQGYESRVLQGARHMLRIAEALEIELSLTALYAGQPLVHEVLGDLHGAGFTPVSLEPAFIDPESGRVLQVDVMLVRTRPTA